MNKFIIMLSALILLSTSIGCSDRQSADMMPPERQLQPDGTIGDRHTFDFNPKVDVLFILDPSESMKKELSELPIGSRLFVDSFGENSLLDYHVGFMSVYDSTRCGQWDKHTNTVLECYPEGQLQPLKGVEQLPPGHSPYYVTRSPHAKDIMFASINIGVVPLKDGGPRFEDIFSPVLKALTPEQNQLNDGFIRHDDKAKFVGIFVTDEDDRDNGLSAEHFIEELDRLKGRGNYILYAVIATNECPRNSWAGSPNKITKAVNAVGGKIFPICKPEKFADFLGKIGADISKKSVNKEIVLNSLPKAGTLKLYYGDKEVPQGSGWDYNPDTLTITIRENIKVDYNPQARFRAEYLKIPEYIIRNGYAKPVDYKTASGTATPKKAAK